MTQSLFVMLACCMSFSTTCESEHQVYVCRICSMWEILLPVVIHLVSSYYIRTLSIECLSASQARSRYSGCHCAVYLGSHSSRALRVSSGFLAGFLSQPSLPEMRCTCVSTPKWETPKGRTELINISWERLIFTFMRDWEMQQILRITKPYTANVIFVCLLDSSWILFAFICISSWYLPKVSIW